MPSPESRGRLAAAQSTAAREKTIEPVELPNTPEGYWSWRVGNVITILPALRPVHVTDHEVWARYAARIIANATGSCPACGKVASLSSDPLRHPASWQAVPLTVGIVHLGGCPAVFGEADRGLFDQRAVGR